MQTFKQINLDGKVSGDMRRNCSLIAITAFLDIPYKEVRELMVSEGFWSSKTNYYNLELHPHTGIFPLMLHCLGIKRIAINPTQKNGCLYTPKTIAKLYPKGAYILLTSSHTMALIDGKIIDWSEGKRLRILEVYQ